VLCVCGRFPKEEEEKQIVCDLYRLGWLSVHINSLQQRLWTSFFSVSKGISPLDLLLLREVRVKANALLLFGAGLAVSRIFCAKMDAGNKTAASGG